MLVNFNSILYDYFCIYIHETFAVKLKVSLKVGQGENYQDQPLDATPPVNVVALAANS